MKQSEGWTELLKSQIQLAGGEGAALRAGSPVTSQLGAGGQLVPPSIYQISLL